MLPALSSILPDSFNMGFARGRRQRAVSSGQNARAPKTQFHLIFFRECPRLHAAFAQVASGDWRPQRMTLSYPDVEVRIAIDTWQ